MRKLYSFLTYCATPFIPLYLTKRGKKNPDYNSNWNERFGVHLTNTSQKPIIWLHSVSVGETRAMIKMVELLEKKHPEYQILITTMTPTGRETAKQLYPNAIINYVPYDIPFCINSFLNAFSPTVCVIMETEIWPNLIYFTHSRNIPIILANARLSDKSYQGYKRFSWVLNPILNSITAILCQDGNTKLNFDKLNYLGKLSNTGNTKFDLELNADTFVKIGLFKKVIDHRKIIVFASTREGEEELIINSLDFSLDVVYLIIPRHPERFEQIAELLENLNIKYQRRSNMRKLDLDTKIVIGDSMGEMLAYYAVSHLAVIGGSFGGFGGQSPIEALFMGIPVVFGPSMYNFRTVAKTAIENNCAIQVSDASELAETIRNLINHEHEYNHIRNNCIEYINKNKGASERVVKVIAKYL
jgi:3-deoxy-D-manno-octulosonic-acid transferase